MDVLCALYRAYDVFSFNVIPVMGQVVAGDWKSYRYLVESIRQFPCQACSTLLVHIDELLLLLLFYHHYTVPRALAGVSSLPH